MGEMHANLVGSSLLRSHAQRAQLATGVLSHAGDFDARARRLSTLADDALGKIGGAIIGLAVLVFQRILVARVDLGDRRVNESGASGLAGATIHNGEVTLLHFAALE